MFWYLNAGTIPLALLWPSGIATTSLSAAAFFAATRLALLVFRAVRTRAVSVPRTPVALEDEHEVKQAAA
jgi:hypothetical protein